MKRPIAKLSTTRLVVVLSILVVMAGGAAAVAQTPSPSLTARLGVAGLKAMCENAIDGRLRALEAMKDRVQAASHLNGSDRSSLNSQLENEVDGLKALEGKITSDTTLAALRPDCRSIVVNFRVYLLMGPKVHLVIAADRILAMSEKLQDLVPKLQARIDAAKAKGQDVTKEQAALDDLKAKTQAAIDLVKPLPGELIPLAPKGYPGNKPILVSAREAIRKARDDVHDAFADAKSIVRDLSPSPGPSPS